MTQDEIIRMARVAGVHDDGYRFEFSKFKYLERFVRLVAKHEREACAKVCDETRAARLAEQIRARSQT